MNKIKIYLRTRFDIEDMTKEYAKTFEGAILKNSFINKGDVAQNIKDPKDKFVNFAYMQLFGDLNILIAHYKPEEMPQWGYSQDVVLSLDSLEKYNQTYSRLKSSNNFKMVYDTTQYPWKTQISKWEDKWGFFWIIESKY